MTNQELDQLVKRANDAGYSTIAEYALALEDVLWHIAHHEQTGCMRPPQDCAEDAFSR